MQIIQISDLHINGKVDINEMKRKIDMLFLSMVAELKSDTATVICILGDIVDRGDKTKYESAKQVIDYIKTKFKDYNPSFEFTPGNHDLCGCEYNPKPNVCVAPKCSLCAYHDFVKAFDETYNKEPIIRKEYPEVDLIIANSVFNRTCKYGQIDVDALEKVQVDKPALLITHYTFLSEHDGDISAMRNAYKIFEVIEEQKIVGVLHGHTHGYKDISIGSNCPIIGVGPFLKDVPQINNQANLIILSETGVQRVSNYWYRGDRDEYASTVVFKKSGNIYKETSVKSAYDKVLVDTISEGVLMNWNGYT